MRRIEVDMGLCDAHGDCVVEAPNIFDLGDDDDQVRVLNAQPGDEEWERVERAIRACPVAAIRVVEE